MGPLNIESLFLCVSQVKAVAKTSRSDEDVTLKAKTEMYIGPRPLPPLCAESHLSP